MKANTYRLSEIRNAIKGMYFHYHEAITGFTTSFRIRALRPGTDNNTYRLIGSRAEQTVSGRTLISLMRYGHCTNYSDACIISRTPNPSIA